MRQPKTHTADLQKVEFTPDIIWIINFSKLYAFDKLMFLKQ